MNYTIVRHPTRLKKFIEFLPDLQTGEVYYVELLARRKYLSDEKLMSTGVVSLKRFTTNKEELHRRLWQLEAPLGSYTLNDSPVPQDALVAYISINPRNLEVATKRALKKLMDRFTEPYNGYNPKTVVMSEIAKSKSRTEFIDFDLDGVNLKDVYSQIVGTLVNREACSVVRTKGGVHLLVQPRLVKPDFKTSFYRKIQELSDKVGDNLVPIPGCVQGKFVPFLIPDNEADYWINPDIEKMPAGARP